VEAAAKAEAERVRSGLTMFTDGSLMDDEATGGRMVSPGLASELTWDLTKRPMMRNAPPSQRHWNRLREDRRPQSGSQSSRMSKLPSEGWPPRSLGPAKSTRSGQGSTPQCYGKPDRV